LDNVSEYSPFLFQRKSKINLTFLEFYVIIYIEKVEKGVKIYGRNQELSGSENHG